MGFEFSGFDSMRLEIEMMQRRANAPKVLGPLVSSMMRDSLARQMKRNPVGQMNRLGPSLIDKNHPDHIFFGQRVGSGYVFTIGTKVNYSYPYRAWRKKNNKRSHFRALPSVRKKVGAVMADYILTGRFTGPSK